MKRLNKRERNNVFNVLNEIAVDFSPANWKSNFIDETIEAIARENSIIKNQLSRKLNEMSEAEILSLIITNDIFWSQQNENRYKSLNMTKPSDKLIEVLKLNNDINFNNRDSVELNEEELASVNRIVNDNTFDFVELNWSYNFMQLVLDENGSRELFKKLFTMSDEELLLLIIKVKTSEANNIYVNSDMKTFSQKLNEIRSSEINSGWTISYDSEKLSELHFLMISQSLKNDLIVYEINAEELSVEMKWSVNSNNLSSLLAQLMSSEFSYEFMAIQTVKSKIINND